MSEKSSTIMDRLRESPVGPVVEWADTHPRLAAWIVLSTAMVALIVIEAWDVGLLVGQWIALLTVTVLVAGLCVLIISFEDDPPEAEPSSE